MPLQLLRSIQSKPLCPQKPSHLHVKPALHWLSPKIGWHPPGPAGLQLQVLLKLFVFMQEFPCVLHPALPPDPHIPTMYPLPISHPTFSGEHLPVVPKGPQSYLFVAVGLGVGVGVFIGILIHGFPEELQIASPPEFAHLPGLKPDVQVC